MFVLVGLLDSCWLLVAWLLWMASLVGFFQLLLRTKKREIRKTKYEKWREKYAVVFIGIKSEPLKGKSGCETKKQEKRGKEKPN